MKRKNKVGLFVLAFSAIASLASCGEEETHTHSFVKHDEVFPTCVDTGTEAYLTCETCHKFFDLEENEIPSPKETPIDPNNHKGTKVLAVYGTYKTHYIIGESFDMENADFSFKCEYCEGNTFSESRKEKIKIAYPTPDATSFTVEDISKKDLKVTFSYSGFEASVNVTLSKKSNTIEGLEPLDKHCGFKPFKELDGVTSTFGEIVYSFSETENGEYKTADELGIDYEFMNDPNKDEPKTIYVKASVLEGNDYEGIEETTTITISHNERTWNTENEDYDVFGCVCQDPIKFEKKVRSVQEINLNGENASIHLDGTSYDASKDVVKDIKYVVSESISYSLGTDLNNLDIAELKNNKEVHGENKMFEVTVETPKEGTTPAFEHKVTVPVTLVTAYIYNNDETFKLIKPLRSDDPNHCVLGHYKLMENVSRDVFNQNTSWGWIKNWNADQNHYVFKGSLDGNGKTIVAQGTFNGLFCQLEGASIKNLTLEDFWYHDNLNNDEYSILAGGIKNTALENVTIRATNGNKSETFEPNMESGHLGWVARFRFMSNTLTNCVFDTGSWNVPMVFASANGNDNSFTNCTLTTQSYGGLWKHWKNGLITEWKGLTINGTLYQKA